MERRKGQFVVGMVVFVLVCLGFVFPAFSLEKQKSEAGRITIIGIVVERETNDKNKVISVFIKTSDQGRYSVINRGKGKRLLKMIDQDVEVTGTVMEVEGIQSIMVESCRIINN